MQINYTPGPLRGVGDADELFCGRCPPLGYALKNQSPPCPHPLRF